MVRGMDPCLHQLNDCGHRLPDELGDGRIVHHRLWRVLNRTLTIPKEKDIAEQLRVMSHGDPMGAKTSLGRHGGACLNI